MAKQAFTSGIGTGGVIQSICDADGNLVYQELLGGDNAPGGDGDVQDDAPIGSLYTNTATGAKFTKVTDTNADADWIQLASSDVVSGSGTGVTTGVNADCVNVDASNCVEWEVMVVDNANPTFKRCITVKAIHDGTATTDATTADLNCTDILKTGSPFNAGIDVVLTGSGTAQEMCLEISSTETAGVDYMFKRVGS